ncbi:E6 early protein [Bos taurus papillomavirus 31]|nr:E6 early protein [Bos taurus papillomavirus 31]
MAEGAEQTDGGLQTQLPDCILCMRCSKPFDEEQKEKFRKKGLKCFQRASTGTFYGACDICCWWLAALEATQTQNEEIRLEGDGVTLMSGCSLSNICVWCQYCLKLLNDDEKWMNVCNWKPFVLRREKWRGTCESCMQLENPQNA